MKVVGTPRPTRPNSNYTAIHLTDTEVALMRSELVNVLMQARRLNPTTPSERVGKQWPLLVGLFVSLDTVSGLS